MSTNHQFPKHTGITDIQIAVGSRCICRPTLRQSFSSCGHRLVDSWSSNHKFRNKQDHGDVKGVGWRCICMYFPTKLLLLRTPTRGLFVGPCDTHLFLFKKLTGWALQLVENKKRRHACIFAAT